MMTMALGMSPSFVLPCIDERNDDDGAGNESEKCCRVELSAAIKGAALSGVPMKVAARDGGHFEDGRLAPASRNDPSLRITWAAMDVDEPTHGTTNATQFFGPFSVQSTVFANETVKMPPRQTASDTLGRGSGKPGTSALTTPTAGA
ncbi:unnamed protein product [Phytophthora lilii]|uniref:Unnamed protein product n=1 Tax=Phytophthora lilii TaxID=2077276 RepID=A0A9W6TKL6_9STRA|nr:unnamed protein product [Phytophthora lilii]